MIIKLLTPVYSMYRSEICKISKNAYFEEYLRTTASACMCSPSEYKSPSQNAYIETNEKLI